MRFLGMRATLFAALFFVLTDLSAVAGGVDIKKYEHIKQLDLIVREVIPEGGQAAPPPRGKGYPKTTLESSYVYGTDIKAIDHIDKIMIAIRELPDWYYTSGSRKEEVLASLEGAIRNQGRRLGLVLEASDLDDGRTLSTIVSQTLQQTGSDGVVVMHYYLATDWVGTNREFNSFDSSDYKVYKKDVLRSGFGIWYEYGLFTSEGLMDVYKGMLMSQLAYNGSVREASDKVFEGLNKHLESRFLS